MQVGLVTPPGVLGEFLARSLAPAGHELHIAPDLEALFEQTDPRPEVVLFAPVLGAKLAAEVLADAERQGLAPTRAVYLGLTPEDCVAAQGAGFARALTLPSHAQELLEAVESSARGRLRILLADDSELI